MLNVKQEARSTHCTIVHQHRSTRIRGTDAPILSGNALGVNPAHGHQTGQLATDYSPCVRSGPYGAEGTVSEHDTFHIVNRLWASDRSVGVSFQRVGDGFRGEVRCFKFLVSGDERGAYTIGGLCSFSRVHEALHFNRQRKMCSGTFHRKQP